MHLPQYIATQTAFSLRLAASAAASGSTGAVEVNQALSPLSIHLALSLLSAGAKGATKDQIVEILGLADGADAGSAIGFHDLASQVVALILADASGSGGPRLAFADSVWVDTSLSLNADFQNVANSIYKAQVQSVDFQNKPVEVTDQVNMWAEHETSGLIKTILPSGSVDHDTRLVLANALYFKGAWTQKFETSKTELGNFHLLDGKSVEVSFMSSERKQYISSNDGMKLLRLPYKQGNDGRQFSMYIILPNEKDGLLNLHAKLNSDPEFLNLHLPVREVPVGTLKVPKFKISFSFEASDLLRGLGLVLPFGADADFTDMVNSPVAKNLFLSSIFHKCFIEVNEEGTEAAAATAAVISMRSMPPPPVDFVADHPFIFIIREDQTGVVLFVGHVINPLLPS